VVNRGITFRYYPTGMARVQISISKGLRESLDVSGRGGTAGVLVLSSIYKVGIHVERP
jgi:hypothetical protein